MKRIALSLIAVAALALACSPAQAFHGFFRQRVVVRQQVVRQRVVVQKVVAPVYAQAVVAQPVYAQAVVAPVYAAPVVQQVVTPGCSQLFYAR